MLVEEKKTRKKLSKKKVVAILLFVVAFLLIFIPVNNRCIVTTRYELESSRLPGSFNNYKIVQLSDIHNASFGKDNSILLKKIEKEKPGVIVMTGDLFDSRRTKVDVVVKLVEKAMKIAPVYYVSGNHEARKPDKFKEMNDRLAILGARLIDGKVETLTKGEQKINILGIKSPAWQGSKLEPYEMRAVAAMDLERTYKDKDTFSILLSHHPAYFDIYKESGIDLVFTGHAHGGQWRLPFSKKPILIVEDKKYVDGLHPLGKGKAEIINRGLGNSVIPLRINNLPEIVVMTLKCGEGTVSNPEQVI